MATKVKTKCPHCAKSFINLQEHITKIHTICCECKKQVVKPLFRISDPGLPATYLCKLCSWEVGYYFPNDPEYLEWAKTNCE